MWQGSWLGVARVWLVVWLPLGAAGGEECIACWGIVSCSWVVSFSAIVVCHCRLWCTSLVVAPWRGICGGPFIVWLLEVRDVWLLSDCVCFSCGLRQVCGGSFVRCVAARLGQSQWHVWGGSFDVWLLGIASVRWGSFIVCFVPVLYALTRIFR